MKRLGIIGAIVTKDVREFSRDRFYVFITILGLVFYVAIYWFLPDSVNETIEVGVHAGDAVGLDQLAGEEAQGIEFVAFGSSEELRRAVEGEGETTVQIGLDFPDDFATSMAAGEETTVAVLVTGEVPEEYRTAMTSFVREIAYAISGSALPVSQPSTETVVLGEDRAGDQVTLQEKMGPMLVFFALLIETLALATLVASEIQSRTVVAVLATPARMSDFLAAKGVFGTLLAFAEALLLVILIGVFQVNPIVILVSLALGAVLVTGFGLIAGSTGRDFVGIVFWSMMFLIPLAIPAFSILFPGSAAGWVRILPSYGLVQSLIGATANGDTLAEVAPFLGMLAIWCVIAFGLGLFTLRRKVATL